jgi:hypothetical protein
MTGERVVLVSSESEVIVADERRPV